MNNKISANQTLIVESIDKELGVCFNNSGSLDDTEQLSEKIINLLKKSKGGINKKHNLESEHGRQIRF
jgi:hypothetical protein